MNEDESKNREKRIKKLAKEGKIVFASSEQAEYLDYYVHEVVKALGQVMDHDFGREYFISDKSTISDFIWRSEKEEQRMSVEVAEILGVKVEPSSYIVDVAKRLME